MQGRQLQWLLMLAAVWFSGYVVTGTHKRIFDCPFHKNDWCIFGPVTNNSRWLVEDGELRQVFTDNEATDIHDRIFATTNAFPPGDYCLKAEHRISEGARLIVSAQELGGANEILKQWDSNGQVTSWTRWVKFVTTMSVGTANDFLLSFTGSRNTGYTGTLIMIERIHMYSGDCSDVTTLDSCEFYGNLCQFTSQSDSSGMQWSSDNGVGRRNVGPKNDHSSSDDGYFASTRASGYSKGDKSSLYSPWYKVDTSALCIELWYFMYGSAVGELNIQAIDSNGMATKMWSRYGEQKEEWLKASILYPVQQVNGTVQEYQVLIQTIQGDNDEGTDKGDIAIDDYRVNHCHYYPPSQSISCGFDYNFCHWSNTAAKESPDFLWTRKNTGKDLSYHILGTESCAFAHKENENQKTTELVSRAITESFCMTFYYKMVVDTDESRLTIYVDNETFGGREKVWSVQGNHATEWLKARVAIVVQPHDQYKVRIRAEFGEEFRTSIVAVDDIVALDNMDKCTTLPETANVEKLVEADSKNSQQIKRWILPTAIGIVAFILLVVVIVLAMARRKQVMSRSCRHQDVRAYEHPELKENSGNDIKAGIKYEGIEGTDENPYEAIPLVQSNGEEYYTEPKEATQYYTEPKETSEYYSEAKSDAEYYIGPNAATESSTLPKSPTRDLPQLPTADEAKDDGSSGYQNVPVNLSASDSEYIDVIA